MGERERRQWSNEFDIKLAKSLRDRAVESRSGDDLDPRYGMLGAADFLRNAAELQITPPIDDANIDPSDRLN